jgi:hypothetical protein
MSETDHAEEPAERNADYCYFQRGWQNKGSAERDWDGDLFSLKIRRFFAGFLINRNGIMCGERKGPRPLF